MNGQTYFTAAELAEIAKTGGLMNFPHTKQGVNALAAREGWNALPSSRKRGGTKGGGGMEYHFQVLPEALQALIAGLQIKAGLIARHDLEAERDRRQLAAIRTSALSAEARAAMDARAEILLSIDGYAISQGKTRAWAIAQFLDALTAFVTRQVVEQRRDAGEILTDREATSLTVPLLLTSQDGFHLDPARIAKANDRSAAPVIKRSALYEWFKARDERGVIALAPAATKEVQPIPAAFADFLKFYARPSKPTIADAHGEYLKAAAAVDVLQRMPLTLSQVKYILRERMNNIEKQVGREGLLTLRSRLAYVTRTTDDMWPTTIYTADGKTFDAEVADPVTKRPIRPEITTVLDVVTRKVVGISLARSENQRSVAEALRNACVASGIPAIFYVDRGPGYRNQALDADVSGLMGRLGITKMHAAPYGSQAKGRIERPNATIWDTLAKRFTTYIGADMDKEAGQKVHKITRRELKEFGESRHLPTWEEFVRLAWAMVEEYNNKIHTSLPKFEDPQSGKTRHMTPNEAWAAHVAAGFEPVPVDQAEVDDLFRPYEIRTASRSEVQWNGNKFFHEALEAYHQKKVMVGYDYHQADRVWVREFDRDSGQPGRLICVARFGGNSERYVPLSFEHAAIENRAKGRLRRLDAKREAIEAERDGLLQIEFEGTEVADFIETAPTPEPAEVALVINNASEAPPAVRRRVFASDADLAVWALANPHEVSARQLEVLRDCMARSNARELFRLSGVDTEALRTLLRAAA
ncbi:MAG: integrase [Rhodobacteraceae bacterium GWE1_64_9]|nr:MAG: integrase [Rhodobacteraceae bacterium GWE1_64_9]HBD91785.1 integrase [Gemmobacter sp.]HBU14074.1 integrase [Gemmobacter sp.]